MRNTTKGRVALLFFSILLSTYANAVTVTANSVGNLPAELPESSALDYTGGAHFWSLNDSGDPEIHRIASDGSLTRTVSITNANNRNWEDIAHDANRNFMFIGDFGNNAQNRTNLRIYKIPYPSGVTANTIAAEEISFSYEDQHHFPENWMNFDAEAFIHFGGMLFIFTKTDGNAIGYTKMYAVPDQAGTYVAMLVDSFYTNDRTTGATISQDGSSLVLISNTHIHLFRNYVGNDFFHGQHTQINIAGGWTQKEGVSFYGNREIYMTDENTGGGNHLYYVDLSSWIPPASQNVTTSISRIADESAVSVYPLPANNVLNVKVNGVGSTASVSLFDITGKIIYDSPVENSSSPLTINVANFPTGVYFYKVYVDAQEVKTARLIISH